MEALTATNVEKTIDKAIGDALRKRADKNGRTEQLRKKESDRIENFFANPKKDFRTNRETLKEKLLFPYENTLFFYAQKSDLVLHIPYYNDVVVQIVKDFIENGEEYPQKITDMTSFASPFSQIFSLHFGTPDIDETDYVENSPNVRFSPQKNEIRFTFSQDADTKAISDFLENLILSVEHFCSAFVHYTPKRKVQNYISKRGEWTTEGGYVRNMQKDFFIFPRAKKIKKSQIEQAVQKIPGIEEPITSIKIFGFFDGRAVCKDLEKTFGREKLYTFYPAISLFVQTEKEKIFATYSVDREICTESVILCKNHLAMRIIRKGIAYHTAKLEHFAIDSFVDRSMVWDKNDYYGSGFDSPLFVYPNRVKRAIENSQRYLDEEFSEANTVVYWQGYDLIYAHEIYYKDPLSKEFYEKGDAMGWTIDPKACDRNIRLNSYGKSAIVLNLKTPPHYPIDFERIKSILLHELAHIVDFQINEKSVHDRLFYAFLMSFVLKNTTKYEEAVSECKKIAALGHRPFKKKFLKLSRELEEAAQWERGAADIIYEELRERMEEDSFEED